MWKTLCSHYFWKDCWGKRQHNLVVKHGWGLERRYTLISWLCHRFPVWSRLNHLNYVPFPIISKKNADWQVPFWSELRIPAYTSFWSNVWKVSFTDDIQKIPETLSRSNRIQKDSWMKLGKAAASHCNKKINSLHLYVKTAQYPDSNDLHEEVGLAGLVELFVHSTN